MKVVVLMAFLVLTAHCVPVSRFPGRIIFCYPFLRWKSCQRLCERLNICRKPPMNRRTTMVPSFPPTTEADLSLTWSPPAPTTPARRGDSI
ncbi:endotoxic shock protective protein U9-ORF-like [Meriones unguiculatus]|uniref:endotoxic shock protective protein U9-ORF-like n=1 Tax=Meriones unguiculatus TaxID=10047 RepID=UPI00293E23E5|nr:endotoxic shock protective protein U9-ORF-like [Meriones unguiculatus]